MWDLDDLQVEFIQYKVEVENLAMYITKKLLYNLSNSNRKDSSK